MNFQVVPDTPKIAPIPTNTVKESLSISLKLFIRFGCRSAIRDCDGNTLTEKELAEYLYRIIG